MRARAAILALTAASCLLAAGCASGERTARPSSGATTTTATGETEDFPETDTPETTQPATVNGKVGEVLTLQETDTGRDVIRVTVDRVRFAAGDEYNRPQRGHFLGVHVRVKALADAQSSLWGDFYVLAKGHHYDADGCCPEGFKPDLNYVDLQSGETAEGWLIFDVPTKHGQVVLSGGYEGGKLGTWSF
jgi:predicted component of type VI protein secretion system